MRSISTYIEYLLMTRHYAFLPGLGGFVMAEHEAKISGRRLLSPGRTVQYNRFMTHDDGLLANVIMEDTGVGYNEAMLFIHHEVTAMLNRVQHEGRCPLGHLGQLFTDEDCHIAFRPADTQHIDPMYYGRENIEVRSWREIEAERHPATVTPVVELKRSRKDDVIEVPRYWLHRAAIILLVVIFFFGNLVTGSHDGGNYASMFDAEAIIGHFSTLEPQSWDDSWESETAATEALASLEAVAPAAEAVPAEVEAAAVEAAPEPAFTPAPAPAVAETIVPEAAPVVNTVKLYYIIIASTTDQAEAQRTLKKFAKKGYDNIGIIERDGRLRLYIDNYPVKSDAEAALNELRKNELFEKAWLLAVKATQTSSVLSLDEWTPLQLIIKEKDNDHFTMELSHLNQPAERDQG